MNSTAIARNRSTNTLLAVLGGDLASLQNAAVVLPLERRRSQRIRLQIPIFVRGQGRSDVEFLELTKTLDISSLGARLVGRLPLQRGDMITLTVPAPTPSSSEFGGTGTPPIQARVLRLEAAGEVEVAAVEFVRPLE